MCPLGCPQQRSLKFIMLVVWIPFTSLTSNLTSIVCCLLDWGYQLLSSPFPAWPPLWGCWHTLTMSSFQLFVLYHLSCVSEVKTLEIVQKLVYLTPFWERYCITFLQLQTNSDSLLLTRKNQIKNWVFIRNSASTVWEVQVPWGRIHPQRR